MNFKGAESGARNVCKENWAFRLELNGSKVASHSKNDSPMLLRAAYLGNLRLEGF